MDKLIAMTCFVRVVESESFSDVARELKTTQSTVSKRVAGLEDMLGTRLLERSTRVQTLTRAGAEFYERCLHILEDIGEAEAAMSTHIERPKGRLRVSVPAEFGRLQIRPRMPRFIDAYPDIEIDFIMDDRKTDLIAEGIDVAVRIGELSDSSLIGKLLGYTRRALVATPTYFERRGHPADLAALKDHNCLVFYLSSTGDLWRFRRGPKEFSVQVNGTFRSNNGGAIKEIVLAHQGLAVLPVWAIERELNTGELVSTLADYVPPDFAIHALYPQKKYTSSKVQCFNEFLKREFEDLPLFVGS